MNKRQRDRLNAKRRADTAKAYNLQRKLEAAVCACGCGRVVTKDNANNFHWDHINPSTKRESVAILVKDRAPIERIAEEIALCQLLWWECHVEKTRQEVFGGSTFNMPATFRAPTLFGDYDGDILSSTIQDQFPNGMPVCEEDGFIVMRLPDGNAISCIRMSDNKYFGRTRDDRWIEAPLWSVEKANGLPIPTQSFHLTH